MLNIYNGAVECPIFVAVPNTLFKSNYTFLSLSQPTYWPTTIFKVLDILFCTALIIEKCIQLI